MTSVVPDVAAAGGGMGCLLERFSLLQVHQPHGITLLVQREDQDSGTESDKDSCVHVNNGDRYCAQSPDVGCLPGQFPDVTLQTHQQTPVSCVSNPVYSRDRHPIHHSNPAALATMLAWQHLSVNSSCAVISEATVSSSNSMSHNNNNNNSGLGVSVFSMRQDSGDSCCWDCDDDYNSEAELTSINCAGAEDEDDEDSEEDVELEEILSGGLGGPGAGQQQTSLAQGGCHSHISSGRTGCSWGADSVDEGFQEDPATPLPLKFSASPPQGLAHSRPLSPQVFLACALPSALHRAWPH